MKLEKDTTISHYKILTEIGKGGMGEVYLAQDTKLNRNVALKILPKDFANDSERMHRFVREAQSASALNHPNIITIYEIGESDGTHFIAAEFIEGETLQKHVKVKNVSLKLVLDIATQIASALQTAHSAGIVHRDIKPDNVMIRADGLAKILDFGIAKLSEPPAVAGGLSDDDATAIKPQSTSPGMIIGTANYMSPEQAKGKEVDARTDIFSFGIVFYEMLTGKRAFEGETALESISSILKDEPKPISQFLPEVPGEIERIVNKTLRKDREERYQTAKDLVIDLKDAKQSLELQNLMERSIIPNQDNNETQILQATTLDENHQTTTNQTVASNPKTKYLATGLLTLILAVGGFFGYKFLAPSNSTQINSIAVLPFENKSSDADSEYLSDGLAESVIYRLSQLPNLKVSPTSSVFRYKGKETDPQTVAKELGVDSVLTGRITQRGDSLSISVNLVDARDGKSLWGEKYERKMSELLATLSEITGLITGKLQLKLSGDSEQKLAKKYTDNDEAYQLYLKGQFHWAKRTKDSTLKAIENYEQAIALDPSYALAYVGIANAYNSMGKDPHVSPKEAIPKAKEAATRALEIDPELAEANTALADSLAIFDWNWAESERRFKRSIQINPAASYSHLVYATSYLAPMKKPDEVVSEIQRAVELEPLSLINNAVLVTGLLYNRENVKALEQAQKAFELDQNFLIGRFWLGLALTANERNDDAILLGKEGLQKTPSSPELLFIVGYAYAKSGKRAKAEQYIEQMKEKQKTQYVRTYWIACIYSALGDKDLAFAELETSIEDKDIFLPRMRIDPAFDPIRTDPRYKDLLKRMGLPG